MVNFSYLMVEVDVDIWIDGSSGNGKFIPSSMFSSVGFRVSPFCKVGFCIIQKRNHHFKMVATT